jgi:hypothetical protein
MNIALDKRLGKMETIVASNNSDIPLWTPQEGPQTEAFECEADIVLYGGSAGSGKTDLAVGKALMKHQRIAIFRRNSTEMLSIIDRVAEIVGHRDGLNQVNGIWRMGNKVIEFCSTPNLGDERKYQGRAKDLLVIDESANFLYQQVIFLMGWVRSTDPNQKCQVLMTTNPPTNAEGRWEIKMIAPWLDPKHPNPAKSGEIRWFAMIDGKETEVLSGDAFECNGESIKPQSRTFIGAKVTDNKYLSNTGYVATLQALPEPLRSQLLFGDFSAGIEDDPWQVVPTKWVEEAMSRWKPMDKKPKMTCVGVDIARGGKDCTVISRRHDWWFDELLSYQGSQTPNGPSGASLVISASRDQCNQYIDVIGVGSAVYDFLLEAHQPVYGINVSESASGSDKSGRLRFMNQRSYYWWMIREALDPTNNTGIALPKDSALLADLTAPRWSLRGNGTVQVESRDDIVKRIGRSPDRASALMLTMVDYPNIIELNERTRNRSRMEYNPYDYMTSDKSHEYNSMEYLR